MPSAQGWAKARRRQVYAVCASLTLPRRAHAVGITVAPAWARRALGPCRLSARTFAHPTESLFDQNALYGQAAVLAARALVCLEDSACARRNIRSTVAISTRFLPRSLA